MTFPHAINEVYDYLICGQTFTDDEILMERYDLDARDDLVVTSPCRLGYYLLEI